MTTGLVFFGRGSSSVDDSYVIENEDRRVDGNEWSDIAEQLSLREWQRPKRTRQQSRNVDRKMRLTSNGEVMCGLC